MTGCAGCRSRRRGRIWIEMIVALQKSGAKVLLAGITLPPNYGPDYIQEFESIYKDLARKNRVALIPFLFEERGGACPGMMQADGIHATAQGNAVVAKLVLRALKPML